MKIAYIYDAIYPYVNGGAEKRVYEIGKRLSQKGHEVHCYGIKWWTGDRVLEKDGMTLHGVCRPRPLYTSKGTRSVKEAIYFSASLFKPLFESDYDLIDCQSFPYLSCFPSKLCSVIKKRPLVVTWLEVWDDYWYAYLGWKGIFGKNAELMSSKLSGNNIAISERTKKRLEKLGVKEERIKVISCGIELDTIHEVKPSEEIFDVLFVGRLIKDKNVDYLMRGINEVKKQLPKIRLGIIGEGPEMGHLKRLCKDLGLENNIVFLGFQKDHTSVISYMKSSSMYASLSTREGFGITALEASACGSPVITIDHPMNAVSDLVVSRVNGYKTKLDPEAIGESILQVLTDTQLRECMSAQAIKTADKYDWDVITKETIEAYENIANTR